MRREFLVLAYILAFAFPSHARTVNGDQTITGDLTIEKTSNQLTLGGSGGTSAKTITSPTPSQTSTVTLPDCGATCSVVLTSGPYTINGTWAFLGDFDISGDSEFKGVTDGTDAVEPDKGWYTENIVNSGATVSAAATGQFGNITSLPLSAGDWDIHAIGCVSVGAATVTDARVVISSFTGNTTTDHVQGDNQFLIPNPVASVNDSCGKTYWRRNITSPTTYYLKMIMTYTGTPTLYGKIWARRIR